MDAERRRNIISSIKSDLVARRSIVFAYLFGSFKDYDEAVGFRDIDIAVYLDEPVNVISESLDIGAELSYRYDIPVDCIPLNYAPLYLRYCIFREGVELFCKDEDLRDDIIEETVTEALDFMPLRQEAIRELA